MTVPGAKAGITSQYPVDKCGAGRPKAPRRRVETRRCTHGCVRHVSGSEVIPELVPAAGGRTGLVADCRRKRLLHSWPVSALQIPWSRPLACRDSCHGPLAADQNVVAAFDHVSGTAAVLVLVPQTVRFQVVDEDGSASLGGDPGVGSAAVGVNAGIGDAQSGPAVHFHVRRPAFRGPDAVMTAARPAVGVLGHPGAIAEAGLFCHSLVSNISQNNRGHMPWR